MIEFLFLSGMGFATFIIYGWQILYELFRHRSMLEYPTPDIPLEWFIFSAGGLGFWWICYLLAGVP